jgi:WD40 repeat protein/serine/threonine protein kinase
MGDEQEKLMELFNEARARSSPEAREAYLADACGGDVALRRQVEALLKADTQAGNFLKPPSDDPPDCEGPGTVIGHYKLLQRIGEGGFGVVYMAEQLEPMRRKVALKIIKLGMDTREVIARFEAERQALAMMDHPNIARVFDAGVTGDPSLELSSSGRESAPFLRKGNESRLTSAATLHLGRPYFVMELVKGIPITDCCDQRQLPPADRLQLFLKVCHAVQHAHQKGIIHRDLKPSNILVTEQDGEAVPKIIDFGVAKAIGQPLTDKTLFTRFEQMIGTPTYMSPEQAGLGSLDVDTRTDIYALGVLLYELLTGTTPVQRETLHQAAVDEVRRLIREIEPPKPSTRLSALGKKLAEVATRRQTEPSTLQKLVRGDLDWIVMRCLEKDRRRRYDTADALAQDIGRHLRHQPVLASPPNTLYLARKFIRRHRRGVVLAAAVGITLILGLVASLIGFTRATQQRRLARQSLYFAHMRLAGQDWEAGQVARMQMILREHIPRNGEPDQRGWEWYYLLSLCHRDMQTLSGHTAAVFAVSVHPSGRWFASGGDDHTVRIWDAESGQTVAELSGHDSRTRALAWSPSGNGLATVGLEGKLFLWETKTWQKRFVLDCGRDVAAVAWSPDGKRVAVGGNLDTRAVNEELVIIWDAATGERLRFLPGSGEVRQIWSLAWQPGGSLLVGGGNEKFHVWDADTGRQPHTIQAHSHVVSAFCWSPDGKRLASCSWDQGIRVWETDTWKKVLDLPAAHEGAVTSVAWSTNGQMLISSGYDGMVRLWNAQTGELQRQLRGHQGRVNVVRPSPQSELLVSGADDGCLKIWGAWQEQVAEPVPEQCAFAWSPDGSQFATGCYDPGGERAGLLNIWNTADGRLEYQLVSSATNRAYLLAWSPDGRKLAAWHGGSPVRVWDLTRHEVILTLDELGPTMEIRSLDWSPDGHQLLLACYDRTARIWSLETKTPIFVFQRHETSSLSSATYNPDGRRIASKDFDGRVLVWDVTTGQILREMKTPRAFSPNRGHQIAWHPAGEMLAAGCGEGSILIWDVLTGREIHRLKGHRSNVRSLSWSPDGQRLVSASEDRTVRIWHTQTGRELLVLPFRPRWIASVSWNPNGRIIALAHDDPWLFDATLGYGLAAKLTTTR